MKASLTKLSSKVKALPKGYETLINMLKLRQDERNQTTKKNRIISDFFLNACSYGLFAVFSG
jgi:hypothetical protein